MTVEEAIALVEQLLERGRLTKVQEIVFRQSWAGQTYLDMAVESDYDPGHIKDVGSELWRSLSQALGEKVTKNNLHGVLKRTAQPQKDTNASSTLNFQPFTNYTNWGEAIDVSQFYGRTTELETLSQWIVRDRTRVVTLLGMGGIGKTALSVKLAEQLQGEFEYVIWRSLRHAPFFHDLVTDCIKILAHQQVGTLPSDPHEQITCLIEYLRNSRCLLILDNFDTLLQQGKRTGCYREGYEPYGELLWRLGETQHQSCVLLTSREKPTEVAALSGDGLPVRTLALSGLEVAAGQTILTLKGLSGSEDETRQLVECYGGNPLALKIAATSIRDLHEGNIANFFAEGTTVFYGIGNLLEQQFKRLSTSEQQVMYWLAINREKGSLTELQTAFTPALLQPKLMSVLESLRWRSLIESNTEGLTQQPVVMEYVTDCLIEQVCQEIVTESPQYLLTHALMQAQAKDYIRDSQIQLIVRPILNQLQITLGSAHQLEHKLGRLVRKLQDEAIDPVGYGGGNLLNLLTQLETDLTGYDFSRLTIRNCDLRWRSPTHASLNLHRVNFTQTTFRECVFAATFGGITSVAFSPDGRCLATSDTNGEIHVWGISNSKQLFSCEEHNSWIWNIAFSPVHSVLASCGQDHTIKLWDITTGECLKTLYGHTSIVTAIAWSPDAKLLASSSYDHTVKVWHLATGQCVQTLEGHNACVWSVAFHPADQILATAGEDNTIRLWDLETGCCVQALEGHQQWVKAIAFSPEGQILASGSFDQTVKLWDIHTKVCLMTLQGHAGVITSVAFSPKGEQLASGSYDQTVKIWDIDTGKCLDTLEKHTNRIWSVAFHPQGHLIASGGDDHAARVWELQTGQCTKTFQGHSNAVYGIAHSWQQNLLASGHEDQTIKLWDVNLNAPQSLKVDLQPFRVLHGHSNRIFSVAFSPNGQFLASASADRTIKLWSPHTGQCLKTLHGHGSWVWAVAFSPDSNFLASGSYDHTIKIWDVHSGECLQTLQGHPGSVLAIAFSPDGKTLFSSGYDSIVKCWDLETGNCLHTWEADSNRVWAVAVSPDTQYVATGGDDSLVRLWDIHTGGCLRTFSGHTSQVLCILFTKDGSRMISSSSDRTIKIWNLVTGDCLATLQNHLHWVWSLSLTPDDQTLLSGSWDETINCWDITTGQCRQTLRPARPYEGMIITEVMGLTEAEVATLKALGALEVN
ncbi:MAG: NACHT domain-containing protein [Nostoc sp. NMS1]|uniref:WD40 repeat domain-containing protein n=1 Tax=unclassified Nostoc TaxID=2593658 RepID=UPI0025F9C8DD|nr:MULTISPECIES: NB-ARC domain-containing protein [unclassified Nostoc]MBN3909245.1 NACHT domain-containing protein [Nostoc sp. NMS1]MBN3993329.1 NACHT domain-containing protein [Nostoc sp. NMS2]